MLTKCETWAFSTSCTEVSLFDRAHWADKYRKRFGRPHLYGTGTIASALAYEAMPPEPFGNDAIYAHAFLVVCQTILERQNR